MKNRERFNAVMNFEKPDDRLPVFEWASWWDQTINTWYSQGLDRNIPYGSIGTSFGHDYQRQFWFPSCGPTCPAPKTHGGSLMNDENDYEKLYPHLYPVNGIDYTVSQLTELKPMHDNNDVIIWFSMDGAFWFPRKLFGIENHFYSFYDYPELYHRILDDLAEYQLMQMEKIYKITVPDFMTIAEDMSYNHGPMLSENMFDEFLMPYYKKVVPYIKEHGTKVIVDTDGDVTEMIPWLKRAGIDGALPLERQAGVDINVIREAYPDFLMIGAFDKMVMKYGESAMRKEFERIMPVMTSGGYIQSVDHQTPPDVSIENYRLFTDLMFEYAEKAVR